MKSIAIFALVMLMFGIGAAQIPHTISYQGYYTNGGGQPITGTYPMTFKLYTQANGGSPTWSQTFASVPITKGVYSVVLDVSTVVFDRQYWLETVINGVTSTNRTQLTGVPYSLAPWAPKDTNVYLAEGNAGIGTTTPATKLDIRGNLTLDPGDSPVLFTGTGSSELNRYLNLINSPLSPSASGLKAGGILISDSYSYANPGKNDLVVRGSVAIGGTSSPSHQLTVWGTDLGNGSFASFTSTNPIICCPPPTELLVGAYAGEGIISAMGSLDDLDLRAGGNNTRVFIKYDGNVGIGTTTPASKLDINAQDGLRIFGYQPFLTLTDANAGNARARVQCANGDVNLFTESSLSGGNEYMVMKSGSGNVGIGTANPAEKLHVAGSFLRVDGAGNEQAYLGGDGAGGDVQLGSSNPAVPNVALYNTATNKYMNMYLGVLNISGGSDVAEPFETIESSESEPGTVMIIDADNPGKLKMSEHPYDPKVAGVVSGAGGVKAGLTLQQHGVMEGNSLIAIAGRVYCKAEALSASIAPGDLLTTSDISGYAMKVTDKERSNGTVIGKAMSSLKSGKGLVLVLINLQ
ncbi:MAG: hypothetical protein HYR76_02305 [Ignavibacteria bacterium]|nr:hypothetical protein [Ignavibacteria bacterium]MBI3764890.1 hypothetical protein [Ignavibacteriales bacterium]